ncbi:hypothetical protein HanIR_Chr09g0445561 [Helianthus annuus]|nr:hypothetical protein HanIR_Chr09g0445561 [Helianthus annuus]
MAYISKTSCDSSILLTLSSTKPFKKGWFNSILAVNLHITFLHKQPFKKLTASSDIPLETKGISFSSHIRLNISSIPKS